MDVGNVEQETEANRPEAKAEGAAPRGKKNARSRKKDGSGAVEDSTKRRCVSTACIGTLHTLLLA